MNRRSIRIGNGWSKLKVGCGRRIQTWLDAFGKELEHENTQLKEERDLLEKTTD